MRLDFQLANLRVDFTLNIYMEFLDDRPDFLELAVVHIRHHPAFSKRSFTTLKLATEMKADLYFRIFCFGESQNLVHPADEFANCFLVCVGSLPKLFINFIAKIISKALFVFGQEQKVGQQFFVVLLESRQTQTDFQ